MREELNTHVQKVDKATGARRRRPRNRSWNRRSGDCCRGVRRARYRPPDHSLLVPPPSLLARRCLPRHGGRAAAARDPGRDTVGRKIGFTNRTTWPDYAPAWGYVYDRTVYDLADVESSFSLADWPSRALNRRSSFASRPRPRRAWTSAPCSGASTPLGTASRSCTRSFPGGASPRPMPCCLRRARDPLLGPWHPVTDHEEWERALSTFTVDLLRDGEVVDRGHASNVLGGPLSALRHLVELLARDSVNPPLAAGEIVTTGTLTRVPPVLLAKSGRPR